MAKISIIIVNHNTADVLKDCIESVFRFESEGLFEIIIVDNYSKDGSEVIIKQFEQKHSNIKSIFLKKLDSFSFSNNRGFDISSCDYILIMNPDIIFTEPVLEQLIKNLEEDTTIGGITPMLMGTDNRFQRNYFQRYPSVIQFVLFQSVLMKIFHKFPKLMNRYLEDQDIEKSYKELVSVNQIPGAFFLTSKKIFVEIGKMDESFKLFWEDMDLSYQIGKTHKLIVNKNLRITHLGGSSFQSDENWWLYSRYIMSMNHFFDKNYNFFRAAALKIFSVLNSIFVIDVEIVKKIFGKGDSYRFKKHTNFLKEFFHHYF